MRLYRFAQDAASATSQEQLQALLQERFYALEEAVAAKVKERVDSAAEAGTHKSEEAAVAEIEQDADALKEVADKAGIRAEEMRA